MSRYYLQTSTDQQPNPKRDIPVCWCFAAVNEVRIEYVELVALHHFRWWILCVIMSLVVLIPFIPCVYAVEVPGLPGGIPAQTRRHTIDQRHNDYIDACHKQWQLRDQHDFIMMCNHQEVNHVSSCCETTKTQHMPSMPAVNDLCLQSSQYMPRCSAVSISICPASLVLHNHNLFLRSTQTSKCKPADVRLAA